MNFRRHLHGVESPLLQITPLLTVVFLLLCLFVGGLAFAPAAREAYLQLPVVAGGQPIEHSPGEMVIEVASNGVLAVNRQALTPSELRARLVRFSSETAVSVVLVRVDPDAPFMQVLGVLDACRTAEIDKYLFVAGSGDLPALASRPPATP